MVAQVTGNEFLDKLLEQAPATASQPKRGQNYNYDQRLYLKPDGTVVSLQGDPVNRAYYQDKGFHMLSDSPGRGGGKSEVEQYEQVEYPKLLKEQNEKARIVNHIRKSSQNYRDLGLEDTFDDYSVEELREYLIDIKNQTGKDLTNIVVPKRRQAREDAQERALLKGVDTAETESLEGFQAKTRRAGG